MGIEVRPLGVQCNIACQYCYQNPIRDAGNVRASYDLDAIKDAVLAEGGEFILFGGEPLMMPEDDLEELWRWGLSEFGRNGIQTNGTLINDNHIRLFREYNVHVGLSIDGPGELNDIRWAGTVERTRNQTAAVEAVIERLCKEGLAPSVIITLHRCNASADRLPILKDWVEHLDRIGVVSARLHLLEVEHGRVGDKYSLTSAENARALLEFAELESKISRMSLDVFSDIRGMLLADDEHATCIWKGCDPLTTAAVRGVEGNGQRSNCGRINKDGVEYVKSDTCGYERSIILYHTPFEFGGCQGCRFFLSCKGQCPGTAIGGDWRNRTEHCAVWMRLLEHMEIHLSSQGVIPISLHENRLCLEEAMLSAWAAGENPSLAEMIKRMQHEYRRQQDELAEVGCD